LLHEAQFKEATSLLIIWIYMSICMLGVIPIP
jgi:hypothetical protein